MGTARQTSVRPGSQICRECETSRGRWQLRSKAFWPYSSFLACSVDWRHDPIQRQTQKLKLMQRQRLNQMLKQTLTPSTTEAVKMVVRGITQEGKTVGRAITLGDNMEVRVHILHSLGGQVVMEGDCHLPMLPYNPAG